MFHETTQSALQRNTDNGRTAITFDIACDKIGLQASITSADDNTDGNPHGRAVFFNTLPLPTV